MSVQCLKISFNVDAKKDFLEKFVQKNARQCHIEGIVQKLNGDSVVIYACAEPDNMDEFIDLLYEGSSKHKLTQIEIEPFFKDRDYRGVFRIIE